MSVDKLIQFKIIIILTKWIVQSFRNSQPPKETKENDYEDRIVEIQLVTFPYFFLLHQEAEDKGEKAVSNNSITLSSYSYRSIL